MANIYDQFADEEELAPASPPAVRSSQGNPYDRFDQPEGETPPKQPFEVDGLSDGGMYEGAEDWSEAKGRWDQARGDDRNANRLSFPPTPNPGHYVPGADRIFGDDPYHINPVLRGIGSGVNAAKNATKSIVGVGGEIMEGAAGLFGIDYDNKAVEVVDDYFPEYVPDGPVDEIRNDLLTAGIGVYLGGLLGGKMVGGPKGIKDTADLTDKIVKLLKLETTMGLGAAATMDEDSGTLMVGEDQAFTEEKMGVSIPGEAIEGDEQDQFLAKKINMALDNIVTGAGAIGGTQGVGKASRWLWDNVLVPISGVRNPAIAENQMFETLIKNVFNLETMSPEQMKTNVQRMNEIIEQEREVTLKADGRQVAADLDPLTAFERGLRRSGEAEDIAMADRVKAQRDGIFRMSRPETMAKMSEYDRVLEGFAKAVTEGGGGKGRVIDAREGIMDSAREQIGILDTEVVDRGQDIVAARQAIEQSFRDDPQFGAKLAKLEQQTGIQFYDETNADVEAIADQVLRGIRAMDDHAAKLYDALPDGVPIDIEGFSLKLKELEGTGAETYLPPDLRKIIQGDQFEILESLELLDIDYKTLHNQILPNLSRGINRMSSNITTSNEGAVTALLELKDHILKDQYSYIAQEARADPRMIAGLEAARDYELIRQDTFRKGTPLGKIKEFADGIRPSFIDQSGKLIPESPTDVRQYLDEGGKLVEQAFNNDHRNTAKTFVEFLASPEGGQNYNIVGDYLEGFAAREVSDAARAGGLASVDFASVAKAFRKNHAVYYDQFPERGERLTAFFNDLSAKQKDLPRLQAALETAQETAETAKREIYGQELRKFFSEGGAEIKDSQEIFSSIFSSNTSTDTLEKLIQRANRADNPEIIKGGLQAAYGEFLMNNASAFEAGFVRKNKNKLIQYAETMFGADKPELVEATRQALDLRTDTVSRNAPESMVGRVPSQALREGTDAISRVITATLGVLNRTAAITRGYIATYVKSIDPTERSLIMLGRMYSNPDEFLRLGTQYVESIKDRTQAQAALDTYLQFLTKGLANPNEGAEGPPLLEVGGMDTLSLEDTEPLPFTSEPQNRAAGLLEEIGKGPTQDVETLPDEAPEAGVDDLEQTEGFPRDSFFSLEDRDRFPLLNSKRTRFPKGVVATWEF